MKENSSHEEILLLGLPGGPVAEILCFPFEAQLSRWSGSRDSSSHMAQPKGVATLQKTLLGKI